MPRFNVVASETHYFLANIEAENEEKAKEIASQLDGNDFEYLDGGYWAIDNIEKIHEKPKQAKLF